MADVYHPGKWKAELEAASKITRSQYGDIHNQTKIFYMKIDNREMGTQNTREVQ